MHGSFLNGAPINVKGVLRRSENCAIFCPQLKLIPAGCIIKSTWSRITSNDFLENPIVQNNDMRIWGVNSSSTYTILVRLEVSSFA